MNNLLQRVWDLSQESPLGFTVDTEMNKITGGYSVAYEETQDSFGYEGLRKVVEFAEKHGTCIGGWFDEVSGRYYFDATEVVKDKAEAIEIGRRNKQIAIFNLKTGKETRLK